ncbi:MAG: hypothetical protein AB7T31_06010 [Gemmatimonadales bacterium]
MRRPIPSSVLLLGTALLSSGCFDQAVAPSFETDGRIEITNDEGSLAGRTDYMTTPVPIDAPTGVPAMVSGPAGAPPALAPKDIDLTLIAEFESPIVSGHRVQATSIWQTSDQKIIVSYNMQGPLALGGLDYFTKLLNKNPVLRSSVVFTDADVNSVFLNGRFAYAATSSSDPSFAFPAVLERIRVKSDRFQVDPDNRRIALSSFAATASESTDHEVYAVSGDGGHVFAFDEDDMTLRGQYALDDARWVAWDKDDDRVVVLQGTPGRLSIFRENSFPGGSMELLNTVSVPGVDVPESKATVEIVGDKAFVAAGPSGVQIVCLDNGQVVGSIPRPDPASLGLSSSVVVTNAVTVQKDLIFISNGEAGVYAAAASVDLEKSSCTQSFTVSVLGRLRFADLQSVNHVSYRDDHLFIAAGLGGVKVVEVDVTK